MDAPAGPPATPAPFVERRATPDGRRLRAPTPRVALLLVAAILLAYVLYLGRSALSPFIVGLLIVYLLDPPVSWLNRRHIPRWIAVLIVYAAVIFLGFEALNLTLRPLIDQIILFVSDLPTLAQRLDAQLQQLSDVYRGLDLPPQLRDAIDARLADLFDDLGTIDPGVLLPVVNLTAGFVGAIFGYILIPVWVFYILKDRRQLAYAFERALPEPWREDTWQVINIVRHVFGQWVKAQVVLGLTVGVATFVGLLILGELVDPVFGRFAVLLALIAGILELLPIIGPIIAAIPALLLALTVGPEAAIAVFLLYLAVQQVENNVLVPKIQGDAVELHPSAVMFALIIGASIAGLLGAILALPIAAVGRNVFRYLFRRLSEWPPSPALAAVGVEEPLVESADMALAVEAIAKVEGAAADGPPTPETTGRPSGTTAPESDPRNPADHHP